MKLSPALEEYRIRNGQWRSRPGDPYGQFLKPGPCGEMLAIMAHDGVDPDPKLAGWEHVSVSTRRRIPNWLEMCHVKGLFWLPEDCVVQFHPPESEYVNNHAHVLHMWRWINGAFPMPPSIMVGLKDHGLIKSAADAKQMQREINEQMGG